MSWHTANVFNKWIIIVTGTINAVCSTAMLKFRITTGDCLALLYLSSTTLSRRHNTSRAMCPEDNQDGNPGTHLDGIQSGKGFWMNMRAGFSYKSCHALDGRTRTKEK